jgi:hypothetical protein
MSPAIGCGGESKRRTAGALKAHRTMCNSSCNSMSCDGANCDVSGSFTFVTFGPHGELLLLASDSFHYPREIRDGLRRGVILVTAAASRDSHGTAGVDTCHPGEVAPAHRNRHERRPQGAAPSLLRGRASRLPAKRRSSALNNRCLSRGGARERHWRLLRYGTFLVASTRKSRDRNLQVSEFGLPACVAAPSGPAIKWLNPLANRRPYLEL